MEENGNIGANAQQTKEAFISLAQELQRVKPSLKTMTIDVGSMVGGFNQMSKSMKMSADLAESMQRGYKKNEYLVASINTRLKETNATQAQIEAASARINNINENAYDIAGAMETAVQDLYKLEVARATNLTDTYASQAAEYRLMVDKGLLTEEAYSQAVKMLQGQQARQKHLQEEVALQESIAASILDIREEAESYKKSLDKVLATARAIGSDPKAMGAYMLVTGVKKVKEFHKGFEELHKQGLSAGQAIEGQFKGMSMMSMLGLSDAKGVVAGMAEQYGNINALSGETVDKLGQMAHHFGISGQEAAKLNASLSRMPGETAETAAHAMEHVGHMAELQGIAPGKIMKDMAANTQTMALFSKGGAEGFGKAAIELHKMGVEIGTASKMAEGLLDFEGSVNKQMEASVLLGREINLDKARELALNGDLEGSTKEVLKNIGGAAEFDKMNVVQKQALAAATGMTVEELQKTIDAQEESNKYFGEGASLMDNIAGKAMEYGAGVGGFLKENGQLMLSTLTFLQTQNFTKLKGYAQDVAHWAKEKAHWLWKSTVGKLMGGGAGDKAKDLSSKLKKDGTLDMRFKENKIPKDLGATNKVPDGAGKSTGGLTKSIEKINPGKLLAGAAALVLVAAAVFVFAKAAQEFTNVSWESIGKAIVGMLALVGALALMGTFLAGPQAIFLLAGAAAMLIVAAAVLVLGLAIQAMAKGFEMFVPSLLQLLPMTALVAVLAASFVVMGYGLMALGTASYIAFPGLMMTSLALNLLTPPLILINELAQAGGLTAMADGLMQMSLAGPGLSLVAMSLGGMAVGLAGVAAAGLAALPIFAALTALAAVGPALGALSGVFGGGGGEKEDKMDALIGEIRELKAIMSQGGVINMDGRKVGDVLRLGMTSSGVK